MRPWICTSFRRALVLGCAAAVIAGCGWASIARADASDVVTGSLPAARPSPRLVQPPDLTASAARGRRRRPWYRFPPAPSPAAAVPGAHLVGMVLDLGPQGQPLQRCSGTVVNSPNGSVVWTAGHCIINREISPAPFSFIDFVPGAGPGPGDFAPSAPYGVWPAIGYATTANWAHHGSARQWRADLGALLIGRNAQGETLKQALGGADRISFRGAPSARAAVFGYPAAGAFAGNDSLFHCGPRPTGRAPREGGAGTPPLVVSCGMTSGASGGPWITHLDRAGIGTVVSVTSSVNDASTLTFGAVQGRNAHAVWSALAHRRVG